MITKLCAPYVAKHIRSLTTSFILTAVQVVSLIPIPLLVESLFKTLSTGGEIRALLLIFGLIFLLVITSALASILNRRITLSFIKEAVGDLRINLVEQTLAHSRSEYTALELDAVHADIVYGTERIDCMVSAMLTQIVPGALVGAGIGVVLVYLNPILACVVLLSLPVLYFAARVVGRRVQVLVKRFHRDFAYFSEKVSFAVRFHELVQMSAAELYESKQQRRAIQDLRFSSGRMALLATVHTIMQGNAMVLVGVIVLLVGGIQIISGTTTLGIVLSFYIALNVLISHVRVAIGALPTVIEGLESLGTLQMYRNVGAVLPKDQHEIEHIEHIETDRVSFGHTNEIMLRDISMKLSKGEMVGLYGPSGSGKSTIVNLLLGLYQPRTGTVRVNTIDLAILDVKKYRTRIGVLTQSLSIFSGTIRENLTYGLENVSDELLREVCTMCDIHEYIESLPEKYDAPVGERGVQLSGGQRQRVALARALIRRPDVLLLDEPDNNLDAMLVGDILNRIRAKNITSLVITHNRSLEKYFDRIYECMNDTGVTTLRERTIHI